nr:MAG TPA: hypothetical protein [Caudoviricetes sp.]
MNRSFTKGGNVNNSSIAPFFYCSNQTYTLTHA